MLLVIALILVPRAAAEQDCPSADGYSFYQLQEVPGAHIIGTPLPASASLANIKAACDSTPRCTAFASDGRLLTVGPAPVFSLLDSSDPATQQCDGVYVATGRTLSGLLLPAGEDVASLHRTGARRVRDMLAAQAAAERVASQLLERGMLPRNAHRLHREELARAFRDSKTPMAQSSDTIGSYSYVDVLEALSYPDWDSRAPNGTAFNYISPVKNQRTCGSCTAFATTAAAEAAVAVGNGMVADTNDFSEQWLFFCNGRYHPTCATGWSADEAVDVLASYGIPYEANYPYLSGPGCTLRSPPRRRTGGKFSWVVYTDVTSAKQHIRQYGSVITYFAVFNDFFYWRASSKPYRWDGVSPLAGYHQVLAIGYNDTGAYWVVKNSWGTGWGDNGFFRISYTANVGFMSGGMGNIIGLKWAPPASTLLQPPPPSPSAPYPSAAFTLSPSICGDGLCAANETCSSCPSDCGNCTVCGDGVCSGGETCSTCRSDCGYLQPDGSRTCCGDGVCSAAAGETCASCPTDCGACTTCNSKHICEPALGERCADGSGGGCSDCGSCAGSFCGDGKCLGRKKGYSESCGTCPQDCGGCLDGAYCGDGVCSAGRNETTSSCPRDCKRASWPRGVPGDDTTGAARPGRERSQSGGGRGTGSGHPSRR